MRSDQVKGFIRLSIGLNLEAKRQRSGTGMRGEAETLDGLLERIAAGDKLAFRALYQSEGGKLFGIAMRICRDREAAEDAFQEAFVDIWRKAAQFDATRGSARLWLAAIARNRSIDQLRRRGRPGTAGTDADLAVLDSMSDARAIEDGGTEFMALASCLDRLDAPTREMVLLAYYQGWQRDELAKRFDRPVNTVKTQLRRGLVALRECLDG